MGAPLLLVGAAPLQRLRVARTGLREAVEQGERVSEPGHVDVRHHQVEAVVHDRVQHKHARPGDAPPALLAPAQACRAAPVPWVTSDWEGAPGRAGRAATLPPAQGAHRPGAATQAGR